MNNYINVEQLKEATGLKTSTCRKIIDDVRVQMKNNGYFVPNEKRKYALRSLVFEYLGIKEK